jgi:hypothetical protein
VQRGKQFHQALGITGIYLTDGLAAMSRTFSSLSDPQKLLQKLEEVAEELEIDMKHGSWTGRTVTLKYKLDTYQGLFIYSSNIFQLDF